MVQSFQIALDIIGLEEGIEVLFGDTVVETAKCKEKDAYYMHAATHFHRWAAVEQLEGGDFKLTNKFDVGQQSLVLCGYFLFSSAKVIKDALNGASDILGALIKYKKQCQIKLLEPDLWLDFGNILSYHQSKKSLMVSRAFNNLKVEGDVLEKRSSQKRKMSFEYSWYKSLPQELRLFTPKVFMLDAGKSDSKYSMEYLYYSPVSDLFVFGKLPAVVWKEVLDNCFSVLHICQKYRPDNAYELAKQCTESLIKNKTNARFEKFLTQRGINKTEQVSINGEKLSTVETVLKDVLSKLPDTNTDQVTMWHGDFFFGNLLYNFRSKRIIMLDPRGSINSEDPSVYGDRRYDVAKLAHSIIGLYDVLIAKRCNFSKSNYDYALDIEIPYEYDVVKRHFEEKVVELGVSLQEVMALTICLFFSMLPLHSEDEERQDILFANGLRLYKEYFL